MHPADQINNELVQVAKYQRLFDLCPDIMCVMDAEGHLVFTNPAFSSALGVAAEELLSQSFLSFVHPVDRERSSRQMEVVRRNQMTVTLENRIRARDGQYRALLWRLSAETETGLVYAVARDVSDQRQAEIDLCRSRELLDAFQCAQSLHVSDQKPQELFNSLLSTFLRVTDSEFGFIGEVLHDPDGTPYLKSHAITNIAWSADTEEFYRQHAPKGLEFRNLKTLFGEALTTGHPVISNTPQDDPRSHGTPHGHPPLKAFMGLPFFHGGQMLGMVGVANRPNGYHLQLAQLLEPLLAACGRMIETYRIESKRVVIQNQLRDHEARIHGILDAAADAIISINARGEVIAFNPAAAKMFGYEAEHVIGRNINMLMPAPYAEQHDQFLENYLRTGVRKIIGVRREAVGRRRDGTTFPIELTVCEVQMAGEQTFTGSVRDISDRKFAERELVSANARFASVLDAATQVSIIATDVQGTITVFNTGAENMLGYRASEMVGHKTPEVFHLRSEIIARGHELSIEMGREISGFEVFVAHAREGHFERREWTYVRRDGRHLTVNLVVTAVRDADGEIAGLLGVAEDISERKRGEKDLRRAMAQAEAGNLAKSEFLANMSHELRTPMNAIIGYSELLDEELIDAKLVEPRRDLARIRSAASHLLRLINDVLDLSKIEAGRMNVFIGEFEIRPFLDSVADTLHKQIHQNRNVLTIACPFELGWGYSDPTKLRQILFNLLDNAAKFTRGGRITLSARRTVEHERQFLELTVTDTGIGMTPEQMQRVFDAFTQAEASTTRRFGGTGLGLTITRRFCEMLGGRIFVQSELGVGSCFTALVPLEATCPVGTQCEIRIRAETVSEGMTSPPFDGVTT